MLTVFMKSVIMLSKESGVIIRMCEICGKYICPPECPSFAGKDTDDGELYAVCAGCSSLIYTRQKSFRKSEMIFCEKCYGELFKSRIEGGSVYAKRSRHE